MTAPRLAERLAAPLVTLAKRLPRQQKQFVQIALDLLLVPVALWVTFVIQAQPGGAVTALARVAPGLPWLLVATVVAARATGTLKVRLYAYDTNAVARTGLYALAVAAAAAALAAVLWPWMSWRTVVVFGLAFFLSAVSARIGLRALAMALYSLGAGRCHVVVYGAGSTGTQLVRALRHHETIAPIAFVDDNPSLQGLIVAGLPVVGPADLPRLARRKRVDRALISIPSLSRPKQAQIAQRLVDLGLEVQTVPSFAQLIGQEALIDTLTPLEPRRLLGRSEVEAPLGAASGTYADRVVLVSGAGGTIGSELCRQVLECRPRRLVLFEMSEYGLYAIERELRAAAEGTGIEIVPVLGSIADATLVRRTLVDNAVQVVLHAAAYKHVPLVEMNPLAGTHNNVGGTWELARAAAAAGVERFLLISSDKAVRPTNVMGASKRLAELIVQDLATRAGDGAGTGAGTIFTMVRFGNVLGSSGSVVPLFQEQLRRGGPLTVTHPDVTRYFMTVPEAVRLVLTAGTMARGGEVFVLDMGAPVRIMDLARAAIQASGLSVRDRANPDGDVEIEITGLRPGEKLFEELTITDEHRGTDHPKIFCAHEAHLSEVEVTAMMGRLREAVTAHDPAALRALLGEVVEGYGRAPPAIPAAMSSGTGPAPVPIATGPIAAAPISAAPVSAAPVSAAPSPTPSRSAGSAPRRPAAGGPLPVAPRPTGPA